MKPGIIKKLDELIQYTNDTFDAVLQVGATRLSSHSFTVTIPAGQTSTTFPTDNFDINTDTAIVNLNTRNGGADATVTQTPGQRAVITISAFAEDTVVSCMILKNTVVAKTDLSVNGNVIKIASLPSDRIKEVIESVSGAILKRGTVSELAINKEELNEEFSAHDANDFPTVTTYKNSIGDKVKEVIYSNVNANGKYQTITVNYFKPGESTRYAYRVGTIVYNGTKITSKTWGPYITV